MLAMAAHARAQELAGTFDQLRVLVKTGDTITVTDQAGIETRGRLTELSPSSLALMVDGQKRVYAAPDVSTIQAKRTDPLANGALWGLGVGATLGLALGLYMEGWDSEPSHGALAVTAALTYGGIGAGIGAGLDALHQSRQVIYAGPRRIARGLTMAPMVGRRTGVALSIGF